MPSEEQTLWCVAGMNRLSGLEREHRESLARAYLNRLRAEIGSMPLRPPPESVAWAVDELNDLAGCVDSPETPEAGNEMECALAEIVSRLRRDDPRGS